MKKFRPFFITALIVASASTVSAQSTVEPGSEVARTNLVSANPIGLLFEWYNGEFEHAVSSTASLAITASRYDFWDDRFNTVDGIVRYYPSGRAIRGFSAGASVGYAYAKRNDYVCYDVCAQNSNESNATLGVRADYVWILGRDQRFAAAVGLGAKRLLGNSNGNEGLPIGRLSIGYSW